MVDDTTTLLPLNPLDWRAGIVDRAGRPTPEFQRRWLNQNSNNKTLDAAANANAAAIAAAAAAQAIINAHTGFGFFAGGLMLDNELLGAAIFTHDVHFPSTTFTSQVSALVNPTATTVFHMKVGLTVVGTITITTGGVGTVAWVGGSYLLTAGTQLTLFAPTPADVTLASVSGIISGTKQ